jgi:beta propeller repeat protein
MALILILSLFLIGKGLALECPISLNTPNDQLYPDISGERIVWEDNGGTHDIHLYNISNGTEARLTSGDPEETKPLISGPRVVWTEISSYNITLLDLSTREIRTLTAYGSSPSISGDRIAWVDIENPAASNISVYDAGNGARSDVITEPYDRPNGGQPALSGENIVWVNGTDLTAIYRKNVTGGTEELANESLCGNSFDFGGCINNPAISGDRIVWSGYRDDTGYLDIFLRDPLHPDGNALTGNDGYYFSPAIDGDRVVWTDGMDIFFDDISDTIPPEIISTGGINSGPRISGNRVVWYKDLGGKKDIYLSTIGSSDPCPSVSFSATPRSGVHNLTVQFNDTSVTGSTHSSRLWDFGDGTNSSLENPVHTYTADGTYSVSLTVSNSVGRGYLSNPGLIQIGPVPIVSFSANRTYGIAPLSVLFTDTSSGDPTGLSWDFGDGVTSTNQSPVVHTYATPGNYTVSLSATNDIGTGTRSMPDYIRVLNGKSLMASTVIDGLDITAPGGMQQIALNTSRVVSTFHPSENTRLALTPPPSSGWRGMRFSSMDGVGFELSGGIIRGNITSCTLESLDLIPTTFVTDAGNNLPVSYLLNLSTYPVNAEIEATIWEGAIPEDASAFNDTLYETSRDFTSILGTAYTLDFVSRNLPGVQGATLNLSVSGGWVQKYGNENNIAVVRLADDLVNETLNPNATFTDAANLDYFIVPSPHGLSRFGFVSAVGSSNLIQMGAQWAATQIIGGSGVGYSSNQDRTPWVQPTSPPRKPQEQPAVTFYGEGPVDTTPAGITREAVIISSTDREASLLIPSGIEAIDAGKSPLPRVRVSPAPSGGIPAVSGEGSSRFTGIAYDVGPDGATFTPPATLSITVPESLWDGNSRYSLSAYSTQAGSWEEIPTEVDPDTRTVSGPVSHLCIFGLFAAEVLPPPQAPVIVAPAPAQPEPVQRTPMGIFTGMMGWLYGTASAHLPVSLAVGFTALATLYASTRRAWLSRNRTWITLHLANLTGLLWASFLFTGDGPFWEAYWILITVIGLNLIVYLLRFDRIDLSSRARRGYVEIGHR